MHHTVTCGDSCRFWLAVQELKKRPIREVPTRVQEIWQEFLAPGAPSAINVDSKSYDKTTQNVKDPGRYAFEDAQVCAANSSTSIDNLFSFSVNKGKQAVISFITVCDLCIW